MNMESVEQLAFNLTLADVHVNVVGPTLHVRYLDALLDKVYHEYFGRLNFFFPLPFKLFIEPDNKLSNGNIDPPIPPQPLLQ